MYPPEVAIEPGLAVKGVLAASDGALELLRLTVDGLDVHQKVVANAEATPTFLALYTRGNKHHDHEVQSTRITS